MAETGLAALPMVLVVDDQAEAREMLAHFLAQSGFAVEQARDGLEALGKITRSLPDAIITDIEMPGMDGFALCRELRRDERLAQVPVIAVTGYSSPENRDATQADFDTLLTKPCQPDALLQALRLTIARTRSLCEASRGLKARAATLRQECDNQLRKIVERTSVTSGPSRNATASARP